MRAQAVFLLIMVAGPAWFTPTWAGGGVVMRVSPRAMSPNVIVLSRPANVLVLPPPAHLTVVVPSAPVFVVSPPLRSSAVILLRSPCDIRVGRFGPSVTTTQTLLVPVPLSTGPQSLQLVPPRVQSFQAQLTASPPSLVDATKALIDVLANAYWEAKEPNIRTQIFDVREQLIEIRHVLAKIDFGRRNERYEEAKAKMAAATPGLNEFKQDIGKLLPTGHTATAVARAIDDLLSIARRVFA